MMIFAMALVFLIALLILCNIISFEEPIFAFVSRLCLPLLAGVLHSLMRRLTVLSDAFIHGSYSLHNLTTYYCVAWSQLDLLLRTC